jgi:putative copper export protein
VNAVLVIVHLLAASIWVGGSVALVFAGVPAIRVLEGEPRGPPATRPTLVVVGWTSLSLTIAVPILGAVLAELAS